MEAGGGAPSEEDGGGIDEAARRDGAGHLADAGLGVALHEVVAVGVGGEGAVVAALPAERDVDVDAEGGQRVAVGAHRADAAVEVDLHGLGGQLGHLVGPRAAADRRARRPGRRPGCGAAGPARLRSSGAHCDEPGTGCPPTPGRRRPARRRRRARHRWHTHQQRAGAFENERFEEEGGSHQGGLGVVLGQGRAARRRAWRRAGGRGGAPEPSGRSPRAGPCRWAGARGPLARHGRSRAPRPGSRCRGRCAPARAGGRRGSAARAGRRTSTWSCARPWPRRAPCRGARSGRRRCGRPRPGGRCAGRRPCRGRGSLPGGR